MALDRDTLRRRINEHPLLAVPPDQRAALTRERMQLTDLLLAYKGFDSEIQWRIAVSEEEGRRPERERRKQSESSDRAPDEYEPSEYEQSGDEQSGYEPDEDEPDEDEADGDEPEEDEAEEYAPEERGADDRTPEAAGRAPYLSRDADRDFRNLYADPRTRTLAYDGLAFCEAAQTAVRYYQAGRGATFLTYFERLYEQQLQKAAGRRAAETYGVGAGIPVKQRRLLRDINRLLEERCPGAVPDKLPAALCEQLALTLDAPAREIARLWGLARLVRRQPRHFEEPVGREGGDISLGEVIADPGAVDVQQRLEQASWVGSLLEAFADLDQREYPRLFLTNDILRPLKEPDGRTDAAAYGRLLLRHERPLFAHVFWAEYLCFVLETPPPPNSIRNIVLARLCRPLQSQTIAAYKNVSKAAVSQQLAAYRKLMETYKSRE